MSRFNPILLAGIFCIFVLVYGGLPLLKGGLYLDTHEGDSYHFLDVVLRMHAGDIPHLDFMTPLGLLAFLPVKLFMGAGYQIGQAAILSQVALGLLLVPFVVYASVSRFTKKAGAAFGFFVLGLATTLSYGGEMAGVSISMHYNRWAWAIAFVALAIALLPARGANRPRLEGFAVGALFSVLILLKTTYFIALVPIVVLVWAAQRDWQRLIWALLSGAIAGLVVVAVYGPNFWLAYASDLIVVAANDVRPDVGVSYNTLLSSPPHIGGTIAGMAAVFLVRRLGQDILALGFLLLVPAFIYITYQNFGNDPFWLVFVALVLIALRPDQGVGSVLGFDFRHAMNAIATACVVIMFSVLFNTALSPIKHAAYAENRFVPMLPADADQDVFIRIDRGYTTTAQVFMDEELEAWAPFGAIIERPEPSVFQGIRLPSCEWMAGSRAYFDAFSEDLQRLVPSGSSLFTTDVLAAFWLFGPFEAPENGTPWYYGRLTGLATSDYLVVPKCSFVRRVRDIILKDISQSDFSFDLIEDNELYALFAVKAPAQ